MIDVTASDQFIDLRCDIFCSAKEGLRVDIHQRDMKPGHAKNAPMPPPMGPAPTTPTAIAMFTSRDLLV